MSLFLQIVINGHLPGEAVFLSSMKSLKLLSSWSRWKSAGTRALGDLQDGAHLCRGREIFCAISSGSAPFPAPAAASGGLDHLVDGLDHVHGTLMVRAWSAMAGHGLADPPGGVGTELVALLILELVDRLDQAYVAFLDQVREVQARCILLARLTTSRRLAFSISSLATLTLISASSTDLMALFNDLASSPTPAPPPLLPPAAPAPPAPSPHAPALR